jgi:transposase
VAQALVGDYRPEHLFTLKQSLEGYRYYQKLILELDQETARLMQALPSATEDPMPPRTKATAYHRQGNDPRFDLRSELYRIAVVDLTDIPGVSAATAQVVLTEIGTDVSRFRNASAFASWLGLCPEKRVSCGKVLSCKTRQVKHRAATALRMGANSLCRAKGYFGEFFRRMRTKLSTAQGSLPPLIKSHASSITSYRRRNPTQKPSSTVVMNRHSGEPKCACANRLPDSASNSCPSR